jgi:hypothetical protein
MGRIPAVLLERRSILERMRRKLINGGNGTTSTYENDSNDGEAASRSDSPFDLDCNDFGGSGGGANGGDAG